MSFVGIDIGTSFIKGAVLDADALSMSHIRRVPFPEPLPDLPSLYREFDPHAVLSAVQQLLADLLPHAAGCEGIVMCSQMHGLILTTEWGEPRSNLTSWQDQRVLEPHPSGEGTYCSTASCRSISPLARRSACLCREPSLAATRPARFSMGGTWRRSRTSRPGAR